MSIRVLFAGWAGELPGCLGVVEKRASPSLTDWPSLSGYTALVLGEEALLRNDPRDVAACLRNRMLHVVLCPGSCTPTLLLRWFCLGLGEVVDRDGLEKRLSRMAGQTSRPWVESDRWLPPWDKASSEAALAVAVIPHLEVVSVGEWAKKLAWSLSRLERICKGTFRISPRAVLDRYILATTAVARRQGLTEEVIAKSFGYSSASALYHSYKRLGVRIPPRDGEDQAR